jgi:uncharacterized coiled-coil protein SlyX
MIKDKRTKDQLLERIAYLEQRISTLSSKSAEDTVTINSLKATNLKLENEVSRCNDLISATTSENNRLTIERNAANALVDRIRIPSDMQISPRSMQQLLDNLNSEIVSALLLVKE